MVGWLCVTGLAWNFALQPVLHWLSINNGLQPPPALDISDLVMLLVGMLGMSGLRTHEKTKGIA